MDLAPVVAAFEGETGIDVTGATAADADLEARVAAGDLPDVAIVSRPALVAELARAGLLVDMSGFVDVARLRSIAGDYLVRLGTVGADGTWPAAEGRLYGAAFAIEAESLVWYPKAAFERAGYAVPRTSDELAKLADADGRRRPNAVVPRPRGRVRLRARRRRVRRGDRAPRGRSRRLRRLGHGRGVLHRRPGAERVPGARQPGVPGRLRARRRGLRPPHPGGDRRAGRCSSTRPSAGSTSRAGRIGWRGPRAGPPSLAAFPFPAADPAYADEVRGRAFTVVVFHDRPEVRRFVDLLLGDELAAAATTSLAPAGIWPTGPPDPAVGRMRSRVAEGERLQTALRAGTFRVAASDLMPTRLAAAFAQATVTYLTWGEVSLERRARRHRGGPAGDEVRRELPGGPRLAAT